MEDSNLSGRLWASQNLEFKNVTFSGNFQTEKFIADGKNILIPEKNRISRIDKAQNYSPALRKKNEHHEYPGTEEKK